MGLVYVEDPETKEVALVDTHKSQFECLRKVVRRTQTDLKQLFSRYKVDALMLIQATIM
jgi:hypothetical protein